MNKRIVTAVALLVLGACAQIPTNPEPDSARYLLVREKGAGIISQLDMQNAEWCKSMLKGIDFSQVRSGSCSVFSFAKSLSWSATASAGISGPMFEVRTRTYEDCNIAYQKMDASFAKDKPRQWFWKEFCMERPV